MQLRREAGLALAGLVCAVGVAAWMYSAHDAATPASRVVSAVVRAPVVAVPAGATFESPQPFRIDAAIARAAVRDGTLRLALPGGREHAIPIERNYTDETGHWNVVGRAQTRVGAQAMVLTFGPDAVFGRIPMPDGSSLHVTTAPGNRIVVAPDGGVVPRRAARVIGQTDAVMPDRARMTESIDTQAPGIATLPKSASASMPTRRPSITPDATRASSAPSAQSLVAEAVDTTPVSIGVITIYTPEQLALRGSVSAVHTEIANLFAITNQAHIDSGSRVRVGSVHVRQLAIPPNDPNTTVLGAIAFSPTTDGVDVEALRDQYAGDLVSVLRPHGENDWTCGVAYTPGFPYARTRADALYGYSVVNVDDDCGTLVHAHELGHNMGSMHDRETDTDMNGITLHGAYAFSSGHRTKAFATVMAYRDGSLEQQWIGRFSNPNKTDCVGAPCGIAGYSDNVRSLNLMAPAIASFRAAANKLAIADVEVLAPYYEPSTVSVPIRLSGVGSGPGVQVRVTAVGGTATEGEDYVVVGDLLTIGPGQREGFAFVQINPHSVVEGDETIELAITSNNGTVADAYGVITISESDPRITLSGRAWFPDGMAPTNPIQLAIEGLDGPNVPTTRELLPPDFAYSVQVPRGMQLAMTANLPDPFVLPVRKLNEVRVAHEEHLIAEPGVLVTGTLRTAPDMVLPEPIYIMRSQVYGAQQAYASMQLIDNATYSVRVPRGSHLGFEWQGPYEFAGNTKPFSPYRAYYYDLRQDTTIDITVSSLPTLVPPPAIDIGTSGAMYLAVNLAGTAPAGGTKFRYRTVDGTAKAGRDYTAVSGTLSIPAGSSEGIYIPEIRTLDDGTREGPQYFDVVIDQVVGAQLPRAVTRIQIHADPLRTGGGNAPAAPR